MNRLDEIKAKALDAAQHVTQDAAKREALADDLITLVGLMIQAVGKSVATNGESDLNEAEDFEDRESAQTRYLTGERIQDGARWAVEESVAADLARYEDSKWGAPVWRPRCPECGVRVGMHSDVQYGAEGRTSAETGHKDDCRTGRRCPSCHAEIGHYPTCERREIVRWARQQVAAEFLQPGTEVDAPAIACKLCHGPDDHGTDCRDVT